MTTEHPDGSRQRWVHRISGRAVYNKNKAEVSSFSHRPRVARGERVVAWSVPGGRGAQQAGRAVFVVE